VVEGYRVSCANPFRHLRYVTFRNRINRNRNVWGHARPVVIQARTFVGRQASKTLPPPQMKKPDPSSAQMLCSASISSSKLEEVACVGHELGTWACPLACPTLNDGPGSSASISAWLRNRELAPVETARAGGRLTELLFALSLTKGLGGSTKGNRSLSVSTSPLM